MNSDSRNLVALPLDVLIEVQAYLNPPDIYSLRLVCKCLNVASRERHVWVQTLQRVCSSMNVGLGTYPVTYMSNLELERAAAAPWRFIDILDSLSTRNELPSPSSSRILCAGHNFQKGQCFAGVELMPGGRWLFTVTEDACVHLWDLGESIRMTASWIHPRRAVCKTAIIEVLTHDDTAYVLITSDLTDELGLDVLQIHPGIDTTEFKSFRNCSVRGMQDFYTSLLTRDHVAVSTLTSCLVWNWMEDEWIMLQLEEFWEFWHASLYDGRVMAWQDFEDADREEPSQLATWNIPTLQRRYPGLLPVVHKLKSPKSTVTISVEYGSFPDSYCATVPRNDQARRSLSVLGATLGAGSETRCHLIEFDLEGLEDCDVTRPKSVIAVPYPTAWWNLLRCYAIAPLVDGRKLVVTNADDMAPITLFIVPAKVDKDHCSIIYATLSNKTVPQTSSLFASTTPRFDVVSGRFCLPLSETQIEIRDYIATYAQT